MSVAETKCLLAKHTRRVTCWSSSGKMPGNVTSREGWLVAFWRMGGWMLEHQAKLTDLLIKEKLWFVLLFAPGKRKEGRVIEGLFFVILSLARRPCQV